MAAAVLAARLVLAAVFAASGLSKLADPRGTRRALTDFGVPRSLAAPVARALPFDTLRLQREVDPVSYTHLTLPTICSV